MALPTHTGNLTNQKNQTGSATELTIELFRKEVERAIDLACISKPYVKWEPVVLGTDTITKKAVGRVTMQKLERETALAGTKSDFSKRSMILDTVLATRSWVDHIDKLQTDFNVLQALAQEQGYEHGRFMDEAWFIQAIKTAKLTANQYGTTDGFQGGNTGTIALADVLDPAKVYEAIQDILVKIKEKGGVPTRDGLFCVLPHAQFSALQRNDLIINGEYVTSQGTKLTGVQTLSVMGIPVFESGNAPFGKTVTGHLLGTRFDGDFSNDLILVACAESVWAAYHEKLQHEIWEDKQSKATAIDTWQTYSLDTGRPELTGIISIV